MYLAHWFLDFAAKKEDILEGRLFIVEGRDKAILLPTTKNEVEIGSRKYNPQ